MIINKLKFLALAIFALLLTSCGDDDKGNPSVPVEPSVELYKTEGYFITSALESSGGRTWYGLVTDEQPSGIIDLTKGSNYQELRMLAKQGEFIYGYRTDGEFNALNKYALSNEDNSLIDIATLNLENFPNDVLFLNESLGYISDGHEPIIYMFDPKSLQITGKVDLSGQFTHPNSNVHNRYTLQLNKKTNKLIAILEAYDEDSVEWFYGDSIVAEIIDLTTNKRIKTIKHENAEYPHNRALANNMVDEDGNTYILCQGSYGLDGKFGPSAPNGSRPQILKINTDSEFDTNYSFNPVNVLGFENNFFQLFTAITYGGNYKAYGYSTAATDSPEILALLQKYAAGTITSSEFQQLQYLILNNESMRLVEIDLQSKTVTPVQNIPFLAGFNYPYISTQNGKVYASVYAPSANFNGYYEIDPNTNIGKKLFNISAGGEIAQFIDLSADF